MAASQTHNLFFDMPMSSASILHRSPPGFVHFLWQQRRHFFLQHGSGPFDTVSMLQIGFKLSRTVIYCSQHISQTCVNICVWRGWGWGWGGGVRLLSELGTWNSDREAAIYLTRSGYGQTSNQNSIF